MKVNQFHKTEMETVVTNSFNVHRAQVTIKKFLRPPWGL